MFKKQQVKPHISAKVRAYGRARVEIAKRVSTQQDWDALWKPPQHPFPFKWGKYWKQCIEYRVDDFAAEVGFFIDVLGVQVIAFDPNYAMFTSPLGEFTFAVAEAHESGYSTPPDAIRIQFMVDDIITTTEELLRRGINLSQNPEPVSEGASMYVATFQTPHGICVDIWGEVTPERAKETERGEVAEGETPAQEEMKEFTGQPSSTKLPQTEVEIDDLFEVIHDEEEPKSDHKARSVIEIDDHENEEEGFEDEIQYVDESETDYPVYQPIPFRKKSGA